MDQELFAIVVDIFIFTYLGNSKMVGLSIFSKGDQ